MTDDPRFLPIVQPSPAASSVPVFQKIAIVGLGLVGGSIALAVRRTWPSSLVIGVDGKDVLEKAMVLHAIDVAADDLVVIAEADLVILAAPIRQNIAVLRELPEHVPGAAVVTDTGSTKRDTVDAAMGLPDRLTFIGGHPLGGAARGGIEFARPDLFQNRPWIFTPVHDAPPSLDRLEAFARALGAAPRRLTPEEHDRLLAYVSHLPQITSSALMHLIGASAGDEALVLSGRGLVDMTRLASSPAPIWRDICATNTDEVDAAIDGLIRVLQALKRDLRSGEAIEKIFRSANEWRSKLIEIDRQRGHERNRDK